MAGNSKRRLWSNKSGSRFNSGLITLVLLAALVALTGGASRFDAIQIIPLRSLSALFLVWALSLLTKEQLKTELTPLVLFALFSLIVVAQLVPLPPSLWQALPGRGNLDQLDAALGIQGIWRPLTLAPMRTWNVLGSLVVPAAGLLTAISAGASSGLLLRLIAALGVANAMLGFLQIVFGSSSIFYFYSVTNFGSPVGLFANENHAAVFAASSMLVVALLGLRAGANGGAVWERMIYPAAFLLILFVSLTGGSRAGFLAGFGAILVSATMVALFPRPRMGRQKRDALSRWLDERPRLMMAVPLALTMLIAVAFLALDRAPAFRDMLAKDSFEDLRWSLWPVIVDMLKDHWVLGAGFGSFEQLYYVYEPSALLMPSYVNQAHNDWPQLIIEGGVLAGLILIALLALLFRAIATLALDPSRRVEAIFWASVFAVLGAASLIDYPLRTPLFQLSAVWLLLALFRDARDVKAT